MVYYYKIITKKAKEEKKTETDLPEEMMKKPDWVKLDKWASKKQLWKANTNQLKQLAQARINQLNYYDLNRDYEYNEKEEALYWVYNSNYEDNPFGKSTIKIPKHLRKHPHRKVRKQN